MLKPGPDEAGPTLGSYGPFMGSMGRRTDPKANNTEEHFEASAASISKGVLGYYTELIHTAAAADSLSGLCATLT